MSRSPGVGVLPALKGVALILWHLFATPFIGRRRLRWGTVETEATAALPGDELVPAPKWSYTLGVAVEAAPVDVWPWIAQLGQGRGGFYTYETLE
ncbi:MAG: SRPBCC family protein, partial [Acidimicrobiia bacterium]